MASKTAIANLAYARIGSTITLSNVDTDTTAQAKAARIFFDVNTRQFLRSFPWPSATKYATLALVGGTSTAAVNNDWQYSYRYPSDCLFARRLTVEGVGRKDFTPPEFRIGRDASGKLIYTDESPAELEYTEEIAITEFDDMMASAMGWLLAANLSPSNARVKDMAVTALQVYQLELDGARAIALNEGQKPFNATSEFERARD